MSAPVELTAVHFAALRKVSLFERLNCSQFRALVEDERVWVELRDAGLVAFDIVGRSHAMYWRVSPGGRVALARWLEAQS